MRTITALFFIVLCSVALSKKLKKYGYDLGAADSCQSFKINGSVLEGSCKNAWGGWVNTSINVNPCIGNNNGALQRGWSEFARTCILCQISGTSLNCTCRRADNTSWASTNLAINDFVGNNNGNFQCGHY
jgi:hypothetical protein